MGKPHTKFEVNHMIIFGIKLRKPRLWINIIKGGDYVIVLVIS